MLADLRYAVRSFLKTPGFSAIVVLTLALGIGANTAIFSVVHGVLLRPFAYDDPGSLLRVRRGTSHPDMLDWMRHTGSFSIIAACRPQTFDYNTGTEAQRLDGALVTGDLMRLLSARAVAGRLIGPDDDRVGGERVVVLSEDLWRTHFGSDPGVVGRRLQLNGLSYAIVGVVGRRFALPGTEADVFAPFLADAPREAPFRGAHTLRAFVRLKPAVTREQAQQEMDALAVRLQGMYPETNRDVRFVLQTLHENVSGAVRQPLLILLGTVAFVLLIACVNVANLLTARAASRRGELAVRAAIGATRGRITRLLLTESLLLAVAGGTLGIVVGYWMTGAIVALAPETLPRRDEIALDVTVLAFAALLSLGTGIFFGMLPAWSAASATVTDISRAAPRLTSHGSRTRSFLVIGEVALALVLVVGAGLLLRSFAALTSQDLGFESRGVLTANLTLNGDRYNNIDVRTRLYEDLEREISALPGVRAVALTTQLPIGGNALFHNLAFEGRPMEPGTEPEVYFRGINVRYFEALGIRLLRGRIFTSGDRRGIPLVAIVNEAFVRQYYPAEEPLGRRIRWGSGNGDWITIVGVVADTRALSLDSGEVPAVHMPYAQEMNAWRRWMDLAVRTDGDPLALAQPIRSVLSRLDPNVPLTRVSSMEDVLAAAAGDRRFNLLLLGGFAALALILAAAGTYGVMSYLVLQRTRELGVRLALGARPADVVRLVVGHGLTLAGFGVAAGLALSVGAARLLRSMLFGVAPTDTATFAVATIILVVAALLATAVPALRAMRIDPLTALRSE